MPSAPPHPCPTCGTPTHNPRCPTCTTQQRRNRRNPTSDAIYRSPRWARLRAQVLREQPICAGLNGHTCDAPSEHCDHIVALRNGGRPYDRTNIQGLCRPCHSRKTAAEVSLGHR